MSAEYREQLSRWSLLLASGRLEEFQAELAANPAGQGARMHLANSRGERRKLLAAEMRFVALAFLDMGAQIDKYIEALPRPAFDPELGDRERFLRWLSERPLTPQQADFVAYQLGEYALLAQARRDHAGHVRFQRLLAGSPLPAGENSRLHLNPIRVWWRLATPGLTSGGTGPQDVLFYAAASEVRVLWLPPDQLTWVRDLAERAPCALDVWAGGSARGDYQSLAAHLVNQGVVALAE